MELLPPARASARPGARANERAARAAIRKLVRRIACSRLLDEATIWVPDPANEGGQAPAIVISSTLTVGESVPRRNTRSLAGVRLAYISGKVPAMVISATGSASAPSRIMNPAAPRL